LAVAQALTLAWGVEPLAATDLAQRLGRGKRSLLGTHGFARGGFLVEGGRGKPDTPGPLLARVSFPDVWRVVLMIPTQAAGMHGDAESRAFDLLKGADTPLALTEGLCRLTLLGMLPALAERDLKAFAEALHDFNARAGQVFASVQGGTYSSQRVAQLVAWLRRQGIKGAGQSSWGPAVFALVEDEHRALHLAGRVRDRFGFNPGEVLVTAACNHGAILEKALE
jgi:beta-RFAP synthase